MMEQVQLQKLSLKILKHFTFIAFHTEQIIVGACQVVAIRNTMGVMSKVALFFENSQKRQSFLEEMMENTE